MLHLRRKNYICYVENQLPGCKKLKNAASQFTKNAQGSKALY